MKTTINGIARFYIDIDTDFWNKDNLKLYSEVFAEVESLEELAEDVLSRYVNGDRYIPKGITITESEICTTKY